MARLTLVVIGAVLLYVSHESLSPMNKLTDNRVVDQIEHYVRWREEHVAVQVAYRRWANSDRAGREHDPDGSMPDQPGVNGLQYASETKYLYYTTTAQELFMRVRVDPATHDPADEPEFVAAGMMGDDFCIDETAGVAYIATHRQNTIDRASLEPSENSCLRQSAAGKPFTQQLIGPTNGAWSRAPGSFGHVAYFLTDGGTKSPRPDGIVRPAEVLRVDLIVHR